MEKTKANPHGRDWAMLDLQARRDLIREREDELREMRTAEGRIPGRGAGYETAKVNADFDKAFNQAGDGEAPPVDLAASEQRYREGSEEAFQAFLALPSGVNSQNVLRWFEAYQVAWMSGRKRVTVQD